MTNTMKETCYGSSIGFVQIEKLSLDKYEGLTRGPFLNGETCVLAQVGLVPSYNDFVVHG